MVWESGRGAERAWCGRGRAERKAGKTSTFVCSVWLSRGGSVLAQAGGWLAAASESPPVCLESAIEAKGWAILTDSQNSFQRTLIFNNG